MKKTIAVILAILLLIAGVVFALKDRKAPPADDPAPTEAQTPENEDEENEEDLETVIILGPGEGSAGM